MFMCPVIGLHVALLGQPVSTAAGYTASDDAMVTSSAVEVVSTGVAVDGASRGRLSEGPCVRVAQADYWKVASTWRNAFKRCLPRPWRLDNTLQISGLKFRDLREPIGCDYNYQGERIASVRFAL